MAKGRSGVFKGGGGGGGGAQAVIGERAAEAPYGTGWKNKPAYGIINEQVGFGRSRKWRISFHR